MKAILIFWQSSIISWAKYYLYLRKLKEREVWKFDQGHISNTWWEQNWNSCLSDSLIVASSTFIWLLVLYCISSVEEARFGNSEGVVSRGWPRWQLLGERLSSNSMRGVVQRRREAGAEGSPEVNTGHPLHQIPGERSFSPWMESRSKIQ